MDSATLIQTLNQPLTNDIWAEGYKIPWHDPGFSSRMLREHLSQDHELASRRGELIAAQAAWILERAPDARSLLDLGCGPGLYAPHLMGPPQSGRSYLGIDFGPASIKYAREHFARPGVEFQLADLRQADFGGPHDLALMLYGEVNVFPPDQALAILRKAHGAVAPGGVLLLEAHTEEAVRALGCGRSWQAVPTGIFSHRPHLCLTSNHWLEQERAAVQVFHVLDGIMWPECSRLATFRSTTRAYNLDEYRDLLHRAGFRNPAVCNDWPSGNRDLLLLRAEKP